MMTAARTKAWCFGALVALSVHLFAILNFAHAQQSVVPDASATEENDTVILRALDKITARITEIALPIGQEVRFGTLAIGARYCRTRPPIETPETFAYLEIDDLKRSGERSRVFEGWMVASSPALNALEHAVYDVWVVNCRMLLPESPDESR